MNACISSWFAFLLYFILFLFKCPVCTYHAWSIWTGLLVEGLGRSTFLEQTVNTSKNIYFPQLVFWNWLKITVLKYLAFWWCQWVNKVITWLNTSLTLPHHLFLDHTSICIGKDFVSTYSHTSIQKQDFYNFTATWPFPCVC
jgi:hypothetical protein